MSVKVEGPEEVLNENSTTTNFSAANASLVAPLSSSLKTGMHQLTRGCPDATRIFAKFEQLSDKIEDVNCESCMKLSDFDEVEKIGEGTFG